MTGSTGLPRPSAMPFAAMIVNEAGIDRLRLEIKSGMENPVDYWSLFVAGKIGYREYKAHFYEKINDNADPDLLDPAGVQFSDLDWRVENVVLPVKRQLEARGRRSWLNFAYVDFRSTELRGSCRTPATRANMQSLSSLPFPISRRSTD
ncbi:MAG: hypothetical protein IPI83_07505 [Sphingomonadales bacterium]|nr:hypothetical protein [Sphingomonadales bacterium]